MSIHFLMIISIGKCQKCFSEPTESLSLFHHSVFIWLGGFSMMIHRGSYMSAHVLLNLLNELGKRDKMRGLPSILSLFRNEFNKFNKIRARMLDSIYHMTLRLLWNVISGVKNVIMLSICTQRCYGRHYVSRKSINDQWFTDFIAWRYFTPRRDVIW